MDAIFKKENVYVLVREKDLRDGIDLSESNDMVILCDSSTIYLYGGRVELTCYTDGDCRFDIDGIAIQMLVTCVDSNGFESLTFGSYLSLGQTVAYLNQMENLGVDSFLENYKLQLQELKKDIEVKVEKLEQELAIEDNGKKVQQLNKFKNFIVTLTNIIFSLLVNMNAGLENHHYTAAYDNIINLYF
jgi:hypothetical protein